MGMVNKMALISYKGQNLGTLDGKRTIFNKKSILTTYKGGLKSACMAGGGNSS